jgi:hypothetical protein
MLLTVKSLEDRKKKGPRSKVGQLFIPWNYMLGHKLLMRDYFAELPTYPAHLFLRCYRMHMSLLVKIMQACKVCVWLRRLLGDLINKKEERVVLNIDNKSAISLCKNPMHHDRSKHIDTKYHYIRECVKESKIEINYVCTDDQLADILTKSLGRLKFLKMRGRIGVQAVKTSISCLGG